MSALLTITIPTFNRAEHLDVLLGSLFAQIGAFKDEIRIVVIDNHSTDDTALRCKAWKQKGTPFEYICNAENIGMARNIIKCFDLVDTEYSWTIGDDDVLRDGMLACVMKILKRDRPDILHFGAQPFESARPASRLSTEMVTPRIMGSHAFARLVHVYITFISCLILRKATRAATNKTVPLDRYSRCVIPQLSWTLEIMSEGQRFAYVPQRLILARDSGTAGYKVCETFSTEIVEILDACACAKLAAVFKMRIVTKYLPAAILKLRESGLGAIVFSDFDAYCLNSAYSRFFGYWLFVVPVLRWPMWLARIPYLVSQLTAKCIGVLDRVDIYVFRSHR